MIRITGEGVFPRIKLDLPRFGDQDGVYANILAEAHTSLLKMLPPEGQSQGSSTTPSINSSLVFPTEEELEGEAERLMVKLFAENIVPLRVDIKGRKRRPK